MGPVLLLAVGLLPTPQIQAKGNDSLVRIRTVEPIVLGILQEGRRRSPTFAALIDRVERSNTFVYVVRGHTLPHGMEGCLVHEGSQSTVGYLKIQVVRGTRRERLMVVLAHELQHVREVLDAGITTDGAALDNLFKHIGMAQRGTDVGEQYETAAAQEVMARVDRELQMARHAESRTDGSARHQDLTYSTYPARPTGVNVIRPTTSILADAVRDGRQRSQTFRAVLDQLETSDLIVYLRIGSCPDSQSIACLSMIGRSAAKRFVQITFVMQAHGDKTILAVFTDHLVAQIGHELQHAIEVADDTVVVNGPTLEAAYKRWGFRPDPKGSTYESEQAIRAGRSVLNELRGLGAKSSFSIPYTRSPRPPEPLLR